MQIRHDEELRPDPEADKAADMVERVAHQIALEICEATASQSAEWRWPNDFVGDVIDRATCRARGILEAMREPTDKMLEGGIVHGVNTEFHWRAMIDAALSPTTPQKAE